MDIAQAQAMKTYNIDNIRFWLLLTIITYLFSFLLFWNQLYNFIENMKKDRLNTFGFGVKLNK